MSDEVQVVVRDGDRTKTYIGLEVSRGPGMMHLILTRPYSSAGQTIDIPLDEVVSVDRLESTPQGVPISELADRVVEATDRQAISG